MLRSEYWKRNTFLYSLEGPVPRRWGQKGRGRRVGGGTQSKASTESFQVAKINTYKGFSIKVPYIWLHKHNTNCKNKAKDFMLISSIKTVSLRALGKWSYEGLTDISAASQCSYKSVNTLPASYCLVCWGCCGKHSTGWAKGTVLRNKTSSYILTLNSCWRVCSNIPSSLSFEQHLKVDILIPLDGKSTPVGPFICLCCTHVQWNPCICGFSFCGFSYLLFTTDNI